MSDHKKEFHFSEREARLAVALMILIIALATIAGYYWGKKRAYEEFLDTCYGQSLGDKVAASLCSLYDMSDDEGDSEDTQDPASQESARESEVEVSSSPNLYFAELAGFGTLKNAQDYKAKLERRSVKSIVLEHVSRTGRGKARTWYQVVTLPLEYETLQALVDKIKAEDRLEGVALVEYTKKHKEYVERSSR